MGVGKAVFGGDSEGGKERIVDEARQVLCCISYA